MEDFGTRSFCLPGSIHFITITKTKSGSPALLLGLLVLALFVFSGPAMCGQITTQISGTFAPSGNYSVNGNLLLAPLATTQCHITSQQNDKAEVSGFAVLDGRLEVTMAGRFAPQGPARYTLLQARDGVMGTFAFVSINRVPDQSLGARITYDSNHVYLEIAHEPRGFPPPLDSQRPDKIASTPASVSQTDCVEKSPNTLRAVSHPTVAGLTFAERVAYQYAIEDIYWRHRIWPKDNPQPKPPLEAVIRPGQLEKKVEDYLSKSQAVADKRGWAISASDLQAEMDRMARDTKQPAVLRELFAAVANDPFVIAECLAKPIVAERLASELNVCTNGRDGSPSRPRSSGNDRARSATAPYQFSYKLPEILDECTDDSWADTTILSPPDPRGDHIAVWTGSEMIVWGGFNFSPPYFLDTGATYTPSTDSWTPTNSVNAPSARNFHSAVWTGKEMIVWGGYNGKDLNDGGRYNPATDTWAAMSIANAPIPREQHSAVWTGSEMIVWGGRDNAAWFNSGGRYNPDTDTWTATSNLAVPERRWDHTAEWTGSEMIVWGGTNQTIGLNTGGRYNPATDSWMLTSTANAPLGRAAHTSIWTGREMIVWGGIDATPSDLNTGGKYNPVTDSWTATNLNNAPSPRDSHSAVWAGHEMIVWGGVCCSPATDFNDGYRYSPGTDSWTTTSLANAPHARDSHTAVWTGEKMIVWGGGYFTGGNYIYLNTGGIYCAQSQATPTPTPSATATPTTTPRTAPTPRHRPSPAPRP